MSTENARIRTARRVAMFCLVALVATVVMAQPTTKTSQLTGTVVEVEGNALVVKLTPSGEVRTFTPPPDRKFIIDGKELTLAQLQPGTTLNATVTETSTPVTARTTETLQGRVFHAAGTSVILRLPSGETKQYIIDSSHPAKFYDSAGKEMSVFDLRKGMNVRATKITEVNRVELSNTVAVTGSAPAAVAQAPAPAPAPRPAPAPAAQPAPAPAPASAPTLPKTGSNLPLAGLVGLGLVGAGLLVRRARLS